MVVPRPAANEPFRRLWIRRGVWLGPLAWAIALAGILLTGKHAAPGSRLGAVLIIAAATFSVVAWGDVPRRVRSEASPLAWRRFDRRQVVALGGFLLSAVIGWEAWLSFLRDPDETFGIAGWLWLLSMAVLIGSAWSWPRSSEARLADSASGGAAPLAWGGLELAAFFGLVALAFVLRTWNLTDLPYAIHNDEVITGRFAGAYLGTQDPSVFSLVWVDLPALWFAGVAASLKVGGTTLAALRFPSALFGAATVIPFYLLVRSAWGRSSAIAGTAILAFSASNVHYSRVTLNNIVTPFFWTVCFYFLLRALRTHRPLDWVWAGLAAGLSEYTYYGTRLLALLLLAFVAYMLVVRWRERGRTVPGFGLLALGYLIGFGPLFASYLLGPARYFGRGTSPGVLMWDHIPRNWADLKAAWNVLWPLTAENFLAIANRPDDSSVYWAPLLMAAEAALFVLGFALLIRNWRYPPAFLTLLWGIGVLFVGGTLVHGVRFLAHWTPAFPAFYVALAVPIGAWTMELERFARRVPAERRAFRFGPSQLARAVLLIALAILAWINVDFYFNRYQVTRPEFEIRAAQSRWEAALGPSYRVRTVGRSWQDYDPELNKYLISHQDGAAMHNPDAELPMPNVAGKGLAFLFFPGNEHYRNVVTALYPGGTVGEVRSHAGGEHLFATYVLGARQVQARYGVYLEFADLVGDYRVRGRVDRVGVLGPDARRPMRARWSGRLYLPAPGPTWLTLSGTSSSSRLHFDGRSGPPPRGVLLQAGWHSFVVETVLTSGQDPPRLLLGQDGRAPTEIPTTHLWPAPAGARVDHL
ncbi:MAG: glycosyltransferase family 39 protein [Acidobacteriota bacterium]